MNAFIRAWSSAHDQRAFGEILMNIESVDRGIVVTTPNYRLLLGCEDGYAVREVEIFGEGRLDRFDKPSEGSCNLGMADQSSFRFASEGAKLHALLLNSVIPAKCISCKSEKPQCCRQSGRLLLSISDRALLEPDTIPEEILTRQALSEPHRTYATSQQREDDQIKALAIAFKENLKKEPSN
jgi:hypothetical protein